MNSINRSLAINLTILLGWVSFLWAEDPYPPYVNHWIGTQDVLVIFIGFQDQPMTLPAASDWDSVTAGMRSWCRQKSYAKTDLRFTLVPQVVQAPKNKVDYSNWEVASLAMQGAQAQGFNLNNFHRYWIATSPHGSTGLAELNGRRIWITFSKGSHAKHEFAHTYGTLHPEGWDDAEMLAPFKQRVNWLTTNDTNGFKAITIAYQADVFSLHRVLDPESVTPVAGGLRGVRCHNTINLNAGVFVAAARPKSGVTGLAVYNGDNLPYPFPTNTNRRYMLPGESIVRPTVTSSGGTNVPTDIRITYLSERGATATMPAETWFALSLESGGIQPPVARDDLAFTTGDAVLITVLANDQDPASRPLSIQAFDATSASGGTVAMDGKSLLYTPPGSFTGRDSFDYIVSNGQHVARGTVMVVVGEGLGFPGTVVAWDNFGKWTMSGGIGWRQAYWSGSGQLASGGLFDNAVVSIPYTGDIERVVDLTSAAIPKMRLRWRSRGLAVTDPCAMQVWRNNAWETVTTFSNPTNNVWTESEVDLMAYAGDPFRFRFKNNANSSQDYLHLDEIVIYDAGGGTTRRIVIGCDIPGVEWQIVPTTQPSGFDPQGNTIFQGLDARVDHILKMATLPPKGDG